MICGRGSEFPGAVFLKVMFNLVISGPGNFSLARDNSDP